MEVILCGLIIERICSNKKQKQTQKRRNHTRRQVTEGYFFFFFLVDIFLIFFFLLPLSVIFSRKLNFGRRCLSSSFLRSSFFIFSNSPLPSFFQMCVKNILGRTTVAFSFSPSLFPSRFGTVYLMLKKQKYPLVFL